MKKRNRLTWSVICEMLASPFSYHASIGKFRGYALTLKKSNFPPTVKTDPGRKYRWFQGNVTTKS